MTLIRPQPTIPIGNELPHSSASQRFDPAANLVCGPGFDLVPFRTIGTQSNRDGIGARIRVKAGKRILIDEVRSGSSYISNNDMGVHFGLGAATKVDWVEVRWPSGILEKFEDLGVDSLHTLREGLGLPANGTHLKRGRLSTKPAEFSLKFGRKNDPIKNDRGLASLESWSRRKNR